MAIFPYKFWNFTFNFASFAQFLLTFDRILNKFDIFSKTHSKIWQKFDKNSICLIFEQVFTFQNTFQISNIISSFKKSSAKFPNRRNFLKNLKFSAAIQELNNRRTGKRNLKLTNLWTDWQKIVVVEVKPHKSRLRYISRRSFAAKWKAHIIKLLNTAAPSKSILFSGNKQDQKHSPTRDSSSSCDIKLSFFKADDHWTQFELIAEEVTSRKSFECATKFAFI